MAKQPRRSYLLLQYRQLIAAIRACRDRLYRLLVTGVIGMPSALLIIKFSPEKVESSVAIQMLLVASPLVVVGFAAAYYSERCALRRYGEYVRVHIDPLIQSEAETSSFLPWETFVAQTRPPTTNSSAHERFRNLSIFFVCGVYGLVACVTSTGAVSQLLGLTSTEAMTIVFGFELAGMLVAYVYSESLSRLASLAAPDGAPPVVSPGPQPPS